MPVCGLFCIKLLSELSKNAKILVTEIRIISIQINAGSNFDTRPELHAQFTFIFTPISGLKTPDLGNQTRS